MKNKSNMIFLHKLIKSFADSMIKIFVPILILQATNDMIQVILYLNVYYIFCGLFTFVLKKLLQKYGIIAIMLHIIPTIAMLFVLSYIPIVWWSVILIAFLSSLGYVLYSVPINLLFSLTDKNVDVAKFQIATCVGKLIFILIGGYILGSSINNSVLLLSIIATVIYFASIIPIMFGYKYIKEKYNNIASVPINIKKNSYIKFNIFHMLFGLFENIVIIVIPLFLYINNVTFETLSIVLALIEVFKILSNMLAKFLVKRNKSFLSCCISIVLFLVGCIIILTIKSPIVMYICSYIIAVSFPLLFVPMFSKFCKTIQKDNNQFAGMTYRDIFIIPTKCIGYIPYFFTPSLTLQFVISMIASLGMGVCCKFILKDTDVVNAIAENVKPKK